MQFTLTQFLLFFLISDDLAIDYQFTFNLSKAEDKHLRGINFKNTPTKHEVDVDFSITCSVPAKMNMTVKYTSGGKVFVYLQVTFGYF